MRGSDIRAIVQQYRPAVSGLRYRMDSGRLIDVSISGQPLDDNKVYEGSTNSFLAGSIVDRAVDHQDTGQARLAALMAYVRRHKTVAPSYDGRRDLRGMFLAPQWFPVSASRVTCSHTSRGVNGSPSSRWYVWGRSPVVVRIHPASCPLKSSSGTSNSRQRSAKP